MKKFPLVILAVISSMIFLSSCLKDSNNTTQPQSGAFLMAQVSPTAPTVSIYFNSTTQILDTLRFGGYSPYVGPINPGTYTIIVDSFGTTTPSKLKSTVTIDANKFYSYFIIDSFNKVKSAFINDVFKAPSTDSVYLRFFNFALNTKSPLTLAQSGGGAFSSNRTFNDQQNNPQYIAFNEVPKGTYSFDLKDTSGAVLKTQNLNLIGGKVYTLFAKGIQGSADTTKALSIGLLENYPQR